MDEANQIINKDEIKALLSYAANNKIKLEKECRDILFKALDVRKSGSEESLDESNIYDAYRELSNQTHPVTGITIIASKDVRKHVKPVIRYAILFFILALSNEMMAMMFADGDIADGSLKSDMMFFQAYVLDKLAPVFWGGLGSCVYLMKLYSDLARDRIFDPDKFGGWGPRVVLGAILGGIIQYIYAPEFLTSSGIDDLALAFLVGLSVKIVYGALEKTIEAIAGVMNLDSTQATKKDKKSFREMAVQMAASKDLTQEQREMLLKVIEMTDNKHP
jgi:hypothetical protein